MSWFVTEYRLKLLTITTHHNGYLLFTLIAHATHTPTSPYHAIAYTRLTAVVRGCQTQAGPAQGRVRRLGPAGPAQTRQESVMQSHVKCRLAEKSR